MKQLLRSVCLVFAALAFFVFAASSRAQSTTVYQLRSDPLAQISGSPGAPTVQPTFAATIALNPNQGLVQKFLGVNSTSATCTVTTANPGAFGQFLLTLCAADATGTVTYTFSTNFLPTATVAPTASKAISVLWMSDGIAWHEVCRSASAQ